MRAASDWPVATSVSCWPDWKEEKQKKVLIVPQDRNGRVRAMVETFITVAP
jgi:hypothetical protein